MERKITLDVFYGKPGHYRAAAFAYAANLNNQDPGVSYCVESREGNGWAVVKKTQNDEADAA